MKFYNRKNELIELEQLHKQSSRSAKMTVLTGRRRAGKTLLALHFAKKKKFLYLFVTKKSETLLCQDFIDEIKQVFDTPIIGQIKTFKDVLTWLLELAQKKQFTLIVDEFQEFYSINPSVYSDTQRLWDLYKNKCKIHLIFIGSVYSMMYKIFQDKNEPLFGRADRLFFIKPFLIADQARILKDHKCYSAHNLFDYYVIAGGMPKYIDLFITNKSFTRQSMFNFMLREGSPFLYEGKILLIEEFGKEYSIYFSILELIALGNTSRPEIESILQKEVGGYLSRLETDYAVIAKERSVHEKVTSRSQRYYIIDNFIHFWFRFFYRFTSAIEMNNFTYVKKIIARDYAAFSGKIFERFFHNVLAETGNYNRIGRYWEKDNQNEIDVVAINDMDKYILIGETKLNKNRINHALLQQKAERLLTHFPHYQYEIKMLSFEDVETFIQN